VAGRAFRKALGRRKKALGRVFRKALGRRKKEEALGRGFLCKGENTCKAGMLSHVGFVSFLIVMNIDEAC